MHAALAQRRGLPTRSSSAVCLAFTEAAAPRNRLSKPDSNAIDRSSLAVGECRFKRRPRPYANLRMIASTASNLVTANAPSEAIVAINKRQAEGFENLLRVQFQYLHASSAQGRPGTGLKREGLHAGEH